MFGRGPRTVESKTESSEFWRPLRLYFGTVAAGWSAIGLLTAAAYLNRESIGLYAWFFEHKMLYATLYVGWSLIRIRALIARWSRETSDEDYTSLQLGDHVLKGIIPLTAGTRLLYVLFGVIDRYFKKKDKSDEKPNEHNLFSINFFDGRHNGNIPSVTGGTNAPQADADDRSGVGKLRPQ